MREGCYVYFKYIGDNFHVALANENMKKPKIEWGGVNFDYVSDFIKHVEI